MYAGFNIIQNFIPKNEFTRPGDIITPDGMVIHWTGNINIGADADATSRFFHNRKGSYGSAHYSLDATKIHYDIPENEMAYHVGARKYYSPDWAGTYPNKNLIGLEICVNMDSDFKKTYQHAVRFVAAVCKKYGWNPHERLLRHWDVTRKDCPLNMINLVNDLKHVRWSVTEQFKHKRDNMSPEEFETLVLKGIDWVRNGLAINGVRGDALWEKFKNDVKSEMVGKKPAIGSTKPVQKPQPQKKPQPSKVDMAVKIMSKYFADVEKDRWSRDELDAMHEMRLKDGTPLFAGVIENGKLLAKPGEPLTREQAAVMMYRLVKFVQENK